LEFLQKHIEALIFCAAEPLKVDEMQACLSEMLGTEVPFSDIEASLHAVIEKYTQDNFPFQIYKLAEGYQFFTKPEYQSSIAILLKAKSKKRLSKAALETLAIIAYKQPITKSHIEMIRGVNCDYSIQKLLEKELIIIQGKADTVGKPILYGTSPQFMEYFGINTLEDLPLPKDIGQDEEDGESIPQSLPENETPATEE